MCVRQQLIMIVVLHHADLYHPQLDWGWGSAGFQGAYSLAVAQVCQVLPIDTQQDVTWGREEEEDPVVSDVIFN